MVPRVFGSNGAAPLAAVCGKHPADPAVATCVRCGRFVCERCLEPAARRSCLECADREQSAGAASPLAVISGVLGILSICTFVPGIAAVALGAFELRRIRSGSAPLGGRGWAQAGVVLGGVALGLGLLFLLLFYG